MLPGYTTPPMSDRRVEKLHKRLVMAPKKNKPPRREDDDKKEQPVVETPKKATPKRKMPVTVEDFADYSDDDHAYAWMQKQIEEDEKKAKKSKKPKVEAAESSDESTTADEDKEEDEDSQLVLPQLDGIEDLLSKPSDTLATCFFKDIWQEEKKYTFVYLKRKGKCVNLQMNCVPWLIQKLCFYYSIRGADLLKALTAINDGRNRIIAAMREANIDNVDLVKELKITKKELQ